MNANIHYDYTPDTTEKLIYEIKKGRPLIANKPTKAEGSVGELALIWLNSYLLSDSVIQPILPTTMTGASIYKTNIKIQ
jgi:hypothetical protein